jgi:4-hydroxymandelate oxidase
MSSVPAITPVPEGIVNLADHETHARSKLDDNAWAYFAGAAGDEITHQENRLAWDRLRLLPRVLKDLRGGHMRTRLLGREYAHPVMLAPVAFQKMAHPEGEMATALAAAMLGAGMVLSSQSSVLLEEVAGAVRREASHGPLWFQLYFQHDRGFVRELVARAEAAGFEALVVTVDASCSGARDRERRARFRLPPGVSAVNLAGLPPEPAKALAPGQSAMFDGLLSHAPTWDDIAWLRAQTRLPILLKGVLHAADARMAQEHGAAGVVVSNHGGRTLDTVVATAEVLYSVREAVDGDYTVLVDGGIQRGTDVLKAVALGADAVLIGRPYVYALANAGAMGVAHVIRLLCDELEIAMALSGVQTLKHVREEGVLLNSR